MKLRFSEHSLRLRHAFAISRERILEKHTFFVELYHDGIVGRGEAAPMARYGDTPGACREALERIFKTIPETPRDHEALIRSLEGRRWMRRSWTGRGNLSVPRSTRSSVPIPPKCRPPA
jgi:L-alanine-DL-glutamate epimerase-like enolase superfamily enzyme